MSPTSGAVKIYGYDIIDDYRSARKLIGLVPQEVALEPFETVLNTVNFRAGYLAMCQPCAYRKNAPHIIIAMLNSPGKRIIWGDETTCTHRQALSHHPKISSDEPTAGVDVELRKDMWQIVSELKQEGVRLF